MCWLRFVCCFCCFVKPARASRADGAKDWHLCVSKPLLQSRRSRKCLNILLQCIFLLMLKLNLFSKWVPIFMLGAPGVFQKRQDDRVHKFRRLSEFKPVHAELMLHWAVSRQCFGSLVLVPIAKMDTTRQIRALESTLIQNWNPPLNYPFILKKRLSKVGPDYFKSVNRMASTFQAPGTRLHRKLRKRLYKLGALTAHPNRIQNRHG